MVVKRAFRKLAAEETLSDPRHQPHPRRRATSASRRDDPTDALRSGRAHDPGSRIHLGNRARGQRIGGNLRKVVDTLRADLNLGSRRGGAFSYTNYASHDHDRPRYHPAGRGDHGKGPLTRLNEILVV